MIERPMPPAELADDLRMPELFVPAPELDNWATAAFLDEDSPLFNEDHLHLQDARIGWVWTNAENSRQGRIVAGTAEMPNPKGGAWQRKRQGAQLREWFGGDVDFLITLDAVICATLSDIEFCALVDHELTHCAQAEGEFGPRFRRDGSAVFALRGHDCEEFVSIVRRYGPSATHVSALVAAALKTPLIGRAQVDVACGTCHVRVA